jgi:hypothetical protein
MRPIIWLFVAVLAAMLTVCADRKFRTHTRTPEQDLVDQLPTDHVSKLDQSLEDRRTVLMARFIEKDRTVKALLRGEITLDEAADHFRDLTRNDPAAVESLKRWFGTTSDEIYYRNVLKFARGAAYGQSPEILAVVAQLEDEVRSRFPPRDGLK